MRGRTVTTILGLCACAGLAGCSFLGSQGPAFMNWEPELSPDATRLVYESKVGETLELFVFDLSAGQAQQITDNEFEDWSPSWSPAGDAVAFASSRDDNADIYVVELETRDVTRLTTHDGDDINPNWGVDGRIYFNSNRTESWEIYVVDPDGSGLTKITGLNSTE